MMRRAHKPLQRVFLGRLRGGGAQGRRGGSTGSLLSGGIWSCLGHASSPPVVLTTGPLGGGSPQAWAWLRYCC